MQEAFVNWLRAGWNSGSVRPWVLMGAVPKPQQAQNFQFARSFKTKIFMNLVTDVV